MHLKTSLKLSPSPRKHLISPHFQTIPSSPSGTKGAETPRNFSSHEKKDFSVKKIFPPQFRSWENVYCIMGLFFLQLISLWHEHESSRNRLLTVMNHYWHDTIMIWHHKSVPPKSKRSAESLLNNFFSFYERRREKYNFN